MHGNLKAMGEIVAVRYGETESATAFSKAVGIMTGITPSEKGH
jgi:hypothetical protein